MKSNHCLALIAALSLSVAGASFAQSQSQGMGDMPMKSKGKPDCMGMEGMKGKDMGGMDMKDMDHQKCMDMMKGADKKHAAKASKTQSHQTDAVVKGVDAEHGKVTLEHEPVKSLGWPAMTMGFAVKDKALFDKLAVGSKVHVEFKKDKNDYVVTAVR